MIGPELQIAIVSALKTAPAVCGGRVYDRPSAQAEFPYVTVGDDQVLDDGNTCCDGWEVFSDIHIWSRPSAGSKLEAKSIAADVVRRLVDQPFPVAGFTLDIAQLETARSLRDPDGLTEHSIITLRHVLQPA